MNKDFDFKDLGKPTPFLVPEGFFDGMQDRVIGLVRLRRERRKRWTVALVSVTTVAAIVVALFFLPLRHTPAAAIVEKSVVVSADNDSWIEQMSDEDLQAAVRLTENEEYLD